MKSTNDQKYGIKGSSQNYINCYLNYINLG